MHIKEILIGLLLMGLVIYGFYYATGHLDFSRVIPVGN